MTLEDIIDDEIRMEVIEVPAGETPAAKLMLQNPHDELALSTAINSSKKFTNFNVRYQYNQDDKVVSIEMSGTEDAFQALVQKNEDLVSGIDEFFFKLNKAQKQYDDEQYNLAGEAEDTLEPYISIKSLRRDPEERKEREQKSLTWHESVKGDYNPYQEKVEASAQKQFKHNENDALKAILKSLGNLEDVIQIRNVIEYGDLKEWVVALKDDDALDKLKDILDSVEIDYKSYANEIYLSQNNDYSDKNKALTEALAGKKSDTAPRSSM